MPTPTGGETISERLKRLRTDLARVRETIARAENNGQANTFGGQQITEIAYERAQTRERTIAAEIAALEGRLAGSRTRNGIAQLQTSLD